MSWGGAILNLRGIIGRIYVKHHITLLHTKYTSFGSCGFRCCGLVVSGMKIFFICFPGTARTDPMGMVVRLYKEDYLTLLHTIYKSYRAYGFREKGFCVFSPM